MALLGRRPIPPTHPLAHDQISFVPKPTSSSTSASGTQSSAPSELKAAAALQEKVDSAIAEWDKADGVRSPESTSPKSNGNT